MICSSIYAQTKQEIQERHTMIQKMWQAKTTTTKKQSIQAALQHYDPVVQIHAVQQMATLPTSDFNSILPVFQKVYPYFSQDMRQKTFQYFNNIPQFTPDFEKWICTLIEQGDEEDCAHVMFFLRKHASKAEFALQSIMTYFQKISNRAKLSAYLLLLDYKDKITNTFLVQLLKQPDTYCSLALVFIAEKQISSPDLIQAIYNILNNPEHEYLTDAIETIESIAQFSNLPIIHNLAKLKTNPRIDVRIQAHITLAKLSNKHLITTIQFLQQEYSKVDDNIKNKIIDGLFQLYKKYGTPSLTIFKTLLENEENEQIQMKLKDIIQYK